MSALTIPSGLNGLDLLWGIVAGVLFLALVGRIARSAR